MTRYFAKSDADNKVYILFKMQTEENHFGVFYWRVNDTKWQSDSEASNRLIKYLLDGDVRVDEVPEESAKALMPQAFAN